jgi:hypothetical protein
MASWFEITFTGDPTDADRERAADLIRGCCTEGQLLNEPDEDDEVELLPGERRAANGVIIGSGAARDIPRFGADENDLDDIPGAQDAGWAAYWAGKPKFRDGE